MVALKARVTMPVTRAVAISEQPLEAAESSTRGRRMGLVKWSRLDFRLKYDEPRHGG